MTPDLFGDETHRQTWREPLRDGATVLRGFIGERDQAALLSTLDDVIRQAPFRHMVTPGGFRMSVAMSNCGTYGWVSDAEGYRYDTEDPATGRPWPALPPFLLDLAANAAAAAGFAGFTPDACLINRYAPGARLSLHQDRDELDLRQPIVSVSLGLPAIFLFGGPKRAEKAVRVPVMHGDVVVWGGSSRLHYHGVLPLHAGVHPLLGEYRLNLTFRKAR